MSNNIQRRKNHTITSEGDSEVMVHQAVVVSIGYRTVTLQIYLFWQQMNVQWQSIKIIVQLYYVPGVEDLGICPNNFCFFNYSVSSLTLEPLVREEPTVVPTSSGSFDVEQIGKLGISDRFPGRRYEENYNYNSVYFILLGNKYNV